MAQKFTVPVTIKNLSSAGSDGLTVFLDQESFARLKVEAGGRITWGPGSGAGDTNLYRDSANVLKTDDTFKAAGLYVAGTQIDPTGATVGDALVFNGTKFVSASVAGGGGATLTVSDTPPAEATEGELWFSSNDLEIFIYYSNAWVQLTDTQNGVQELYELVDVLIDNPIEGDVLVYNGAEWTNSSSVSFQDISTSTFTGNLVPSAHNTYTLGTSTTRWADIYLGPGTLNITDNVLGTNAGVTVSNGVLQINGANQLQVGQLKFVNNNIESTSASVNIEIGQLASPSDIVMNRDVVLGTGKSLTFPDATVQTTAYKGPFTFGGYYGSFYDTTNLLLTSASTAYALPLNTTAEAVGVSIVSGSRITVANAGVYNIQFSAQLDKTDSNNDLVNIWFAKNGTNIPNSNTQVTVLGNNGKYLASWNFVLTLAANDYVQIMIQSPDTNMRVIASGEQSSPARPAVPSSIVTVTQVR
jgi:hypothetical protein